MAINNFNVGVGTTSQLTRYRYVATGGETSVSGTDADGKTLSYTVGLEQVFLNGVNLVRGQDYTATNGTSVGALTALVASDVVEVFAYVPFNIANALTVSTVDAKGDLLVGTGADAVGRLAVGSNNAVLTADSTASTGTKWNVPDSFELINTGGTALTAAGTITVNVSGKSKYLVRIDAASASSASSFLVIRLNSDTGSNYSGSWLLREGTGMYNDQGLKDSILLGRMGSNSAGNNFSGHTLIMGANSTAPKPFVATGFGDGTDSRGYNVTGIYIGTSTISSISIISGTGNFDGGTVYVYGAI